MSAGKGKNVLQSVVNYVRYVKVDLKRGGTHWLVEVVSHRVSQGSYCIVQDEQILVLVLSECKDQRVQDEAEVGHQLCARLLLQRGKSTNNKKLVGKLIPFHLTKHYTCV